MSTHTGEQKIGEASTATTHLLEKVVRFSAYLRQCGLEVTTAETLDAVRSLPLVDLSDKERFYLAMRATLVKRLEDFEPFRHAFERFWTGKSVDNPRGPPPTPKPRAEAKHFDAALSLESWLEALRTQNAAATPPSGADEEESKSRLAALYSPAETLREKTFRDLYPQNISALKRGLKRFSRRVATRPGRRLTPSRRGVVDLKDTLRTGLNTGGHIFTLRRKTRKTSRPNIVVLCDISGSMDTYSDELLRILYYFCNTSIRAKVVGFSTRLIQLNKYLEGRSLSAAAQLVSHNVNFWSSGTRIGSALGTLLSSHPGLLRPTTVLLIISDGWELDNLETLEANLRAAKRRVNRIVWLNPLADSPDYQPLTAGMRTAMPYIDIFAGLKIFTDRHEFECVLGKSITPHA